VGLAIVLKLTDHNGQRVYLLHVLIFQISAALYCIYQSGFVTAMTLNLTLYFYIGSALP
jgi:hypothetical protein